MDTVFAILCMKTLFHTWIIEYQNFCEQEWFPSQHFDGLIQERRNSIAITL